MGKMCPNHHGSGALQEHDGEAIQHGSHDRGEVLDDLAREPAIPQPEWLFPEDLPRKKR